MHVLSSLLVALQIVVVAVAHHRPSVNEDCSLEKMGRTACAIDRTHVLECDGTRWMKTKRHGCLPGCCYQLDKHDSTACFHAREGDCLYLDADSDDDDPKTHNGGNLHRPRQEPDLSSIDTRCNPLDLTSIQRATPEHTWLHHFTCEYKGQCKDLDGHGACYLGGSLYLVPAANESTQYYSNGTLRSPGRLRTESYCNPVNPYESLKFNGTDYAVDGICHEPFVCHDFGGRVGFTFCHHPNNTDLDKYLPWPVDPNSSQESPPSRKVTRCYNDRELQVQEDGTWIPYMNCTRGFTCHTGADDSGMVGCSLRYQSEMWMGHDYMPEKLPSLGKRFDPESYEAFINDADDFEIMHRDPPFFECHTYWDKYGLPHVKCDSTASDSSHEAA